MQAIASLLDPVTNEQTKDLWRVLEEKCGLAGIKTTPYPHFSWLSCEDLDWARVCKKLEKITSKVSGFRVNTAGIGIFPGANPILYIPVIKTPELLQIHQLIWKEVAQYLIKPQDYYLPDQWMPHITLAHGDLNQDNLACAIRDLALDSRVYEIFVDNISVIFHIDDKVGVNAVFKLE